MTAFKFRLAPVLRFRERAKEQKQLELDALSASCRRLKDEIEAIEEQLGRVLNAAPGRNGEVFSASELRLYADFELGAMRRIAERRSALDTLRARLVAKREELVEALRAVKTLEQLRHRLEEKFRREERIAEQKLADEIGRRSSVNGGAGKKIPR